MKDIAYYNGKIGRIDEVQAPITDRGFYFGDGVYDAAMVNNKKIFELEDHLDRFYNSLKLLRIEPPMQRDELKKTLNELVSQLDSDAPHMLYWQSTRAVAHRMHAFPKGGKASLMAFSEPCGLDRQDHPSAAGQVPGQADGGIRRKDGGSRRPSGGLPYGKRIPGNERGQHGRGRS